MVSFLHHDPCCCPGSRALWSFLSGQEGPLGRPFSVLRVGQPAISGLGEQEPWGQEQGVFPMGRRALGIESALALVTEVWAKRRRWHGQLRGRDQVSGPCSAAEVCSLHSCLLTLAPVCPLSNWRKYQTLCLNFERIFSQWFAYLDS